MDNINSFIQVPTVNTNDLLVRVDQTGTGTLGVEQNVFLLTGAATGGDPLRVFFDGTHQAVT